MKRMAVLAAAAVTLAMCACRQTSERAAAPALGQLESLARFRPPADGLLTDAQIERYIRIRRAARGRTDVEAVRAVGADLDEYAWVRARVIEAIVALDSHKVREAAAQTYEKTITALRQARQNARDRISQRTLEEQIAGLERERASLTLIDAPPVAVSANARRVGPRRAEIEALSP